MKKILSVLIALILTVSCFVLPTSALAVKADWTLATGPATLEMTEEGPTLSTTEGQSFVINSADIITVNDFECTFTVARDDDENKHTVYLTLNMSRSHAGNNSGALFLILYFEDRYTLKMEGQILHTGLLLQPTYEYFSVDTTKPITVRGKIVDANHYSVTVDGDSQGDYTFEIPVNYPFHQKLEGNAFFGFGIGGSSEWNENLPTKSITIKSVNGKDYTGLPEDAKKPATDNNEATGDENQDANIGTNNNANSNSSANGVSSDIVIILVIAIAVLFLLVVAVVVFLVIYMLKQKKKEEERKARARAKKAARLAKEKAEAEAEAAEENTTTEE